MQYYLHVTAISIFEIYGMLILRVHNFGSDPAAAPVWADGSTCTEVAAGT